MSGWMAVSCPPWRSCVMPGWHTKKKGRGGRRIAIETAHPGNHLLQNPSCGIQHLLFTAPYGTVLAPNTVISNVTYAVRRRPSHSDVETSLLMFCNDKYSCTIHVLLHPTVSLHLSCWKNIPYTCNMAALTRYENVTRHRKISIYDPILTYFKMFKNLVCLIWQRH